MSCNTTIPPPVRTPNAIYNTASPICRHETPWLSNVTYEIPIAFARKNAQNRTSKPLTRRRAGVCDRHAPETIVDREVNLLTIARQIRMNSHSNLPVQAGHDLPLGRCQLEWLFVMQPPFPRAETKLSEQPGGEMILRQDPKQQTYFDTISLEWKLARLPRWLLKLACHQAEPR